MTRLKVLPFVSLLFLVGCSEEDKPISEFTPPVAAQKDKVLTSHGHERRDEYYWIRDDSRSDPEMLALLEAENAFTRQSLAHLETPRRELFNEISSRMPTSEQSVPVRQGDYLYYREFREGGEYPLYLRAPVDNPSDDQVILDANVLSKDHAYFSVGNWSVAPDQNLFAYAEDTVSRREYDLRIKRLDKQELLADTISGVSPDFAWANDNQTIFYVEKHPLTLLPYKVMRHCLGHDEDSLVYEESDDTFYTEVYKTRSKRFVVIELDHTDSTEIRLIDANNPAEAPAVFLPREPDHRYRVRHIGDQFYILTNWQASNYRLMTVPEDAIGAKDQWTEVIAHRDDVMLEDVEVFDEFLVVQERENGLSRIRVIHRETLEERFISFDDPTYAAWLHSNPNIDTHLLRYGYSSLTTPESVYEFNMRTGASTLLKQDEVVGSFDPDHYRSERHWFKARDGVEVPISLVYHVDKYQPGSNPAYLYAYGSYGYGTDPYFQSKRLSLLDRGYVFAIIHVRGGDELGRHWYEDGRLFNKWNTFNDFIDGTRYLAGEKLVDAGNVFAAGGSAGGLLMGVVANEAPALYRGIVAHVPFVDVVTTMLDESIPLTTGEYTEWGDPRQQDAYEYMLSYSPYDQVRVQDYPNLLVTTGLHDSQVQYFEPVKWVSRLRRLKTDDHQLLMHINMETGHGGASGRYEQHQLNALEYAFILDLTD